MTKSWWRLDSHELRKLPGKRIEHDAGCDVRAGEDVVRTPLGADAPAAGGRAEGGVSRGRRRPGKNRGGFAELRNRQALCDVGPQRSARSRTRWTAGDARADGGHRPGRAFS